MAKHQALNLGSAEKLFRDWNDFEPGGMEIIDIPEPKGELIDHGPIYQWDYTSPKWHEGKTTYYYHHFLMNPPHMFEDEIGNYFSNGKIKVTPLGIDDWDYSQETEYPRYPSETVAQLGILEKIKVIDPESYQIKTFTFGDRYMSGDPEGDWVFISSPADIAVENPTLRQEIHNVLRAKGLSLDAFDKFHPDFPKVKAALKEAGIWGHIKETGEMSENPITLGDLSLLAIVALSATTIFGHLMRKVIDEWWDRGEKEIEEEERLKENPALDHPYGGIRPGGGYTSATEYEIGGQKIAEATHCILGSLHKVQVGEWIKKMYPGITGEGSHIREELDLINRFMDEYRKEVYIQQLIDKPDNKYVQRSLETIPETSDNLMWEAIRLRDELSGDLQPALYDTAYQCYSVLIELAKAMKSSMAGELQESKSAFRNRDLIYAVKKLNEIIDKYLEIENPDKVLRCERPLNSFFLEDISAIPFMSHSYFVIDGKKLGYGFDRETGSFIGEDQPERKKAKEDSVCYEVPLDKYCILEIIEQKDQLGYETKSFLELFLNQSCHRWADEVERLCLKQLNSIKAKPPWALDEWITPKEDSAILAVEIAEKIGAASAYYEPTEKGNYRIHLKWRVIENPTLSIPIHSEEQIDHLFKAQNELLKAGVIFDTGYDLVRDVQEWKLDYSLEGAKLINPYLPLIEGR